VYTAEVLNGSDSSRSVVTLGTYTLLLRVIVMNKLAKKIETNNIFL